MTAAECRTKLTLECHAFGAVSIAPAVTRLADQRYGSLLTGRVACPLARYPPPSTLFRFQYFLLSIMSKLLKVPQRLPFGLPSNPRAGGSPRELSGSPATPTLPYLSKESPSASPLPIHARFYAPQARGVDVEVCFDGAWRGFDTDVRAACSNSRRLLARSPMLHPSRPPPPLQLSQHRFHPMVAPRPAQFRPLRRSTRR